MNNLLVNGCSYTAGSGMAGGDNNISPIVWSNHLADRFDTVDNLAMGGESNDRIVRTTLDFCNNHDMTDYAVIIQWTSVYRSEYWNAERKEWVNVVVNNGLQGADEWTLSTNEDTDGRIRDAYDKEMKWLNSPNDYNIAYYNNILILQNYFEYMDIPYMFSCMTLQDHPCCDPTLMDLMHLLNRTTTEINLRRLMDKSKWSELSLAKYSGDNYISQEDSHPNLKGNKLIAQALYKELMEKYGR